MSRRRRIASHGNTPVTKGREPMTFKEILIEADISIKGTPLTWFRVCEYCGFRGESNLFEHCGGPSRVQKHVKINGVYTKTNTRRATSSTHCRDIKECRRRKRHGSN